MGDSWEDQEDLARPAEQSRAQPRAGGLNPNASSFSFNPGAATFAPTGFAQPQTAPPGFVMPSYPPPAGGSVLPPTSAASPSASSTAPSELARGAAEVASPSTTQPAGADRVANGPTVGPSANAAAEKLEDLKVSSSTANGPSADKKSPDKQTPPPAAPDDEEDETEDEAARAKREAELQQIYEELAKEDPREHMNVVFIGHVDAGKSTTGGQILYLTGGVDERTIQKYEKEAKDKNRESWYMAYIMDTNEEERQKGKTVEVGRAHFNTEKKRYTILDAPGHKNYVPNMIAGAAQADVGVLVIAARKGEFETGFERGGQTREHAQLAKTLGVAKLIVAVNKMDDPSVINEDGSWSKERYDEIVNGLTPFLRSCGYNAKKDVIFLPMSGLLGHNIKDRLADNVAPWYKGGSLFEVLDNTDPLPRDPLGPFRMSVIDKYKDMGTIAMGKSEAGIVRKGDRLYVMPNKQLVTVTAIYRDDVEVNAAKGGENLRLRLTGVEEEEMQAGFVICSRHVPVPCVTHFDAQLQLLDLLEHKSIFTAGYKAVLHIHSLVEECEITRLIASLDMKTRPPTKKKVKYAKSAAIVIVRIEVEKAICVELFENVPQLGRFTLRDEGRTIAIGKIVKLPKSLKDNAPEAK